MRRQWQPTPWFRKPWHRYGMSVAVLVYLYLALNSLSINYERLAEGIVRGWAFIQAFAQPDFSSRSFEIFEGFIESIAMTVVATALGIILSIPLGLGCARNISPAWLVKGCRALVGTARALPEIIIAIFLVKMFGFGPLAGMLTLVIATIGFFAKLMGDEIETASVAQLEAIQATGASWWQWVNYAVQPQILPRMVGLAMYRLDINFRESAVIGIVGAGGIGATLNTAFGRYEFETAAAVLLLIIVIVMACEYTSGWVRRSYL